MAPLSGVVVFEVSPDKIMRDALGLGWDLHKLEELRRLKIALTRSGCHHSARKRRKRGSRAELR
jgi:hypothetical protein